jgi:hypothetical protein
VDSCLAGVRHHVLLRLARQERVVALVDRPVEPACGAPGDDREPAHRRGPRIEHERLATGHGGHAREQLGRGQRLGERGAAADLRERHVPARAKRVGQQRVVADLGMGVERQVVGGERDVVAEQRAEPLGEPRREPDRREVPEQPVVDEHELCLLRDRALEQRPLRRDAGDDTIDLPRTRYLESIGAEVVERGWVQQLVEGTDQLVDVSHLSASRGLGSTEIGQIERHCRLRVLEAKRGWQTPSW